MNSDIPFSKTKPYSDYVYNLVKKICTEIGPGCPFSPQERQRALAIQKELENVTDSTTIEEFKTTNAYLGWFIPGMVLCLIAVGCFYLSLLNWNPLLFCGIAWGIGLFVFLILILEFFLSVEFIDFLFPKKISLNVIGKVKNPEGSDPSRIIIFSGHHDTSPEFLILKYTKYGYYVSLLILFSTVIGVMIGPAIRFFLLLFNQSTEWNTISFSWFSRTIVPLGCICGLFFLEHPKANSGGRVPGAIDNLTSSCIAIALAGILKKYPEFHPKNTEIRFISFGAEEANMKGSWAYAKGHLVELKGKDAMVINMESIANPDITILTSDNNGFTKNSMELVRKVEKAAIDAKVNAKVEPFPFGGGGTDAYGFSRYKIKATSLFALKVPSQMVEFYHQSSDNYDKVNIQAIENVLKICLQFLHDF